MGPILFAPGGDPPWGNLYLTFHIIFVFILSSIINHHSSLINHQSSIISHQSSVINHQSSMINDQSSVILYQLSIVFMKNNELPRRNGSGIGFMRCWLVEPKQKNEIFHCYNGLGGSSRGVDGVYGEKHGHFGGHEGHLGTLKNQNCQERS